MTKTERKLHEGAERKLPGSGDMLVRIYRCAAGRGPSLAMAAACAVFLTTSRSEGYAMLKEMVRKHRPTRTGPKEERYHAAMGALDDLAVLAGLEPSR